MKHNASLQVSFTTLLSSQPSPETSLAHTESKDPKFFRAFRVPDPEDVMRFVGRKGKVVDETFLVCQWMQGSHVRMFKNGQVARRVWNGGQTSSDVWWRISAWQADCITPAKMTSHANSRKRSLNN